jgi:hypothetical protein
MHITCVEREIESRPQAMSSLAIPTLEEAKAHIYSLDLSPIINKLVMHCRWSIKEAMALSNVYRNFLYLNKKFEKQFGRLPPSEELDEFWHNHILDTVKYREDCTRIFGEYFDHYPYFGIDGVTNSNDLSKAFKTTEKLYFEEFGIELPKVRARFSGLFSFIKIKFF